MKTRLLVSSMLAAVLFVLQGCMPKGEGPLARHPGPGARALGGGTDVGSGGNGAEAEWNDIASELVERIRKVNSPQMDRDVFMRIKNELPALVKEASVHFKDYPLIHGTETSEQDNPSGVRFADAPKCDLVASERNLSRERDAINFSSRKLIKVSRPRFSCYRKGRDEVRRLILHEYLGLMGLTEVEDGKTTYRYTNAILKSFESIQTFDSGLETTWIHDCRELQEIGSRDYRAIQMAPVRTWRLANDIDCAESETWNEGAGFKPFVLNGHLDGNGYAIRNLRIKSKVPIGEWIQNTNPNEYLHTVPDGHSMIYSNCYRCVIANLSVEKASVEGGAILIASNNGTVTNVSVDGVVYGKSRNMGGLAEYNAGGTISHCSADVVIKNAPPLVVEGFQGGLVAHSGGGVIHHARVKSKIEGSYTMGGFIGVSTDTLISHVTATTDIVAKNFTHVGGLIGWQTGALHNSVAHGRIRLVSTGPASASIAAGLVGQNIAHQKNHDIDSKGLLYIHSTAIRDSATDVVICGMAETAPERKALAKGLHIDPLIVVLEYEAWPERAKAELVNTVSRAKISAECEEK